LRDFLNNFNKHKTPIIVGFDPGLTVGIAILDLNGDLLYLNSFKEISKSEIINIIMEQGTVVLIATDVEQTPKAVKKLASSLNSKIFTPKSDIPVSHKTELVNNFLNNIGDFKFDSNERIEHSSDYNRDAHKRDSLAAAIIAYNNYKKKLNQLERKFLEAKMNIGSIEKEDFINDNYYEILNQAKSFLILDNPISISISLAFEKYGLIDDEDDKSISNINQNSNEKNRENSYNDSHSNSVNYSNKDSYSSKDNYIFANDVSNDFNNDLSNDFNNDLGNSFNNALVNDFNNGLDNGSDNEDFISIEDIVALETKIDKLKKINKSKEKQFKNQTNLIEDLKKKNESYLDEIEEKNQKINKLEKELTESSRKEAKAILKDKELASKVQLLKNIQSKYKEEKQLRESLEEKLNKRLKLDDFNELSIFTPIKIIDSFTKSGLNEVNKIFKIKKGDVVYLRSSKGGGSQTAKFLVDSDIKAIIKGSNNNENIPPQAKEVFEDNELPILNENDLDIKFFDDYAVANSKELNEKIAKWKSKQRDKNVKKAEEGLLSVIEEYRVERKRKL